MMLWLVDGGDQVITSSWTVCSERPAEFVELAYLWAIDDRRRFLSGDAGVRRVTLHMPMSRFAMRLEQAKRAGCLTFDVREWCK